MKTGCRAILDCVIAAGTTVHDIDFFDVCTCIGYTCPDVGSRLIAHMGLNTPPTTRSSARVIRSMVRCAGLIRSPMSAWPVLGIGGLGHLAVQYTKAAGFETIAVSHSPNKDKMIRDLGADEVVCDGKGLAAAGGADVILSTSIRLT